MMLVFWRKRPIELANPWWRHHHQAPSTAETELLSFQPRLAGSVCGSAWGSIFFFRFTGKIRMRAQWAAQNGHTRSPGASGGLGHVGIESAEPIGFFLVWTQPCPARSLFSSKHAKLDRFTLYCLYLDSTSSHH